MNLLEQLPQPVIFAHRGASAHAPENTLAAFRLAVDMRAPAIELDVKLTADRKLVVFHDLTVDRTTNGHGPLKEKTLPELRQLDAGSFFGSQFRGETIPTLDEVFESVGRLIYINIELTNYAAPLDGLADEVADLVKKHGMQDRVMFSSFFPTNLIKIRKLLPGCPAGLLTWEGTAGKLARGMIGAWITPRIIHPYTRDVTEAFMAHQKRKARRVHVWTVNDPQDMRRLFALGVNGIFTDDPPLALKILEEA